MVLQETSSREYQKRQGKGKNQGRWTSVKKEAQNRRFAWVKRWIYEMLFPVKIHVTLYSLKDVLKQRGILDIRLNSFPKVVKRFRFRRHCYRRYLLEMPQIASACTIKKKIYWKPKLKIVWCVFIWMKRGFFQTGVDQNRGKIFAKECQKEKGLW